jgi:hypothetical protein
MRLTVKTFKVMGLACIGTALALCVLPANATERRNDDKPASRRSAAQTPDEVEMFAAIEAGELDVQIIPRDSTEARLLLKSKTGRPLRVQLPAAFAAVPVLAQIGGGAAGGGLAAGGGGGGGGQAVGGGAMGFGGPGGAGAGGGFFNVPAERVGKFDVPLVCLEHGKKEPRAAIPYKIMPLAQFSSDPILRELLITFGKGKSDQRATQAAAWHVANRMSWADLSKKHIERLAGSDEPYFTRQQIDAATQLVGEARRAAAEDASDAVRGDANHGDADSPGERAK